MRRVFHEYDVAFARTSVHEDIQNTMRDIVGWLSSFILLLTLCEQIHKQWAIGNSDGVSKWLYIGQMAANIGFIVYSAWLGNTVFLITNALLLLSSTTGLAIVIYHHRRQRQQDSAP
jgi:MtN3 and saliva related transmembrane protein